MIAVCFDLKPSVTSYMRGSIEDDDVGLGNVVVIVVVIVGSCCLCSTNIYIWDNLEQNPITLKLS